MDLLVFCQLKLAFSNQNQEAENLIEISDSLVKIESALNLINEI